MTKKEMSVRDLARMGGKARAKVLTAEQRKAIGRKGAKARWSKKKET